VRNVIRDKAADQLS